ncbi:MAG TPA: pseudouridine synthase [Daejeonella sp.]|nr:pseudouridine synthase [Daejeonella sp.]
MPFKKNRNSREDKSTKFNKPARSEQGFSSKGRQNARPEGSNNMKKKLFGEGDVSPSEGGFKNSGQKRFGKPESGKSYTDNKKPYGERKSFGDKPFGDKKPYGERKSFGDKSFGDKKPYGERKPFGDKPFGDKKPYGDRKPFSDKSFGDKKPYGERKSFGDKPFNPRSGEGKSFERKYRSDEGNWTSEEHFKTLRKKASADHDDLVRLNRYIANAGICSRRKADELISAGVVSVNGEVVTELGFKVDPAKDLIRYNGETLKREKMIYVLLNKPKDYITTTDDPQERKTVMKLVEKASKERIYPVGRLDRNTTGLLLLTNDGDLAEKLSHPRNNITKIYQVELNKNLTQGDFNKIAFGLELEDGPIKPDQVSYITGGDKNEIGIQIHSGKNRIVRRIFEHLGYEVVKLDRVVYAQLTKKDLPRGRWRYLEEKEVIRLKHLMQ